MEDDAGPPHLEPEVSAHEESNVVKDESPGCAASPEDSKLEITGLKKETEENLPPVLETIVKPAPNEAISEDNTTSDASTVVQTAGPKVEQMPPVRRKKKNIMNVKRTPFTLRPRKAETPVDDPVPKKRKYVRHSIKTQNEKTLPPELPLAESPSSATHIAQEGNVPPEMPLLHSETSSTASSEIRVNGGARRRRKYRLNRKKKNNANREMSKERTVPSPSLAECNVNAACPESSATANDALRPPLCLCGLKTFVFVNSNNNTGDLTCQALDTMDDRIIGCCNPLPATTVGLHRASTRTPYIMLCAVHVQRLLRHNCCPGCGLFCTQGKFLVCNNLHQYHKQCARPEGCLHCGEQAPPKIINTSMKSRRDPVFLPRPRPSRNSKPAKISITRNKQAVSEPLSVTLNSELERWVAPAEVADSEKYSYKNLLSAVKAGDGPKLMKMMNAGLNPNHVFTDLKNQTPLHIAACLGYKMMVNLLLQIGLPIDLLDADQYTALHLAIISGHLDVVRYLVKAGSSLILKGRDGMTPLHLAAKNGHAEACSILLSAPCLPRRYIDTLDDGGWTALVWGAEYNHLEVVRLLLREGGDPLIRDVEQNIALHWAAFSGCDDVVELLLSSGCDISAVNVQGDTPLHVAARQNKYDCVLLLIARGARSDIKNNLGETPLDCAVADSKVNVALKLNQELKQALSRFLSRGPHILSNDISRGMEKNPIQCVNDVDDEPEPRDFIYINESCFTSRIIVDRTVTAMQNCCCEDNCTSGNCACTSIQLSAWYDSDGKLSPDFNYNDPPMIFECNQICGCNRIICQNRVVQYGISCRFQMFRTKTRGWAIRTLNAIPKGGYVCEYVGEVITDSEADQREDDSYLFDLDNREGESYCVDARKYGNMSRFINHMCSPNLVPVDVFIEHQDLRFPRIAFFANQDIEPNTELGYNYGEKFWMIKGKSFTCSCGWENCMYSAETIHKTLESC